MDEEDHEKCLNDKDKQGSICTHRDMVTSE